MSELAAEAVEKSTKMKTARPESDTWTQFRGVYRQRSGAYGASIWDRSSRTQVWLGSFGTVEDAARAYAAAKLPPARKKTARPKPDAGTGVRGVQRRPSGAYGASIGDPSSRTRVWLGTFKAVEAAAAAVKLAGEKRKKARSKFRGVYRTASGKHGALIVHSKGKVRTWLGSFDAAEDAARAYDAAAVELHGARAITNFGPDSTVIPGTLQVQGGDLSTAKWQQVEELLKEMDCSTDDKVALIDAAAILHQIALAGQGNEDGGRD